MRALYSIFNNVRKPKTHTHLIYKRMRVWL